VKSEMRGEKYYRRLSDADKQFFNSFMLQMLDSRSPREALSGSNSKPEPEWKPETTVMFCQAGQAPKKPELRGPTRRLFNDES
jgi:hypothetical protein